MGKTKQWKSGGDEDKYIKKLIKQRKVTKFTKPPYLLSEHPSIFSGFSSNVIRNHLNEMKRKCGLFGRQNQILNVVNVFLNHHFYVSVTDSGTDDENEPNDPTDMSLGEEEKLIEAGNSAPSASSSNVDTNSMTGFDKVIHQNYPIVCKAFTDPDTDSQKVLLVISLPGGCDDVKVEVADQGRMAIIRYQWTKSMYDVKDLFKVQLERGEFSSQHALISCFKAGLAESRKRIDFAPVSTMKVSLPIQVQKVPDTWKKWGIFREDGTQVLICIFSAIATEYVISETEDAVKFGK